MKNSQLDFDVIIIGAGPAGSVAAALLQAKGYRVQVIERQYFPRFSIGESLLPQCMEILAEADLLDVVQRGVEQHSFQFKNGAAFSRGDEYSEFSFDDKFSPGWGSTYQVLRAPFDHLLIAEVERRGVDVAWGHEIISVDMSEQWPRLGVKDPQGEVYQLRSRFVFDASGFGRVLPRLLALHRPSNFPVRTSLFTHIEDNLQAADFDRDKIRIIVHQQHSDVWFWLIPFANGRSSLGVVARSEFFEGMAGDADQTLRAIIDGEPSLQSLLDNAVFDTPARKVSGFASNVSRLWGPGFALLGNAGEFLDPVFSSGVTIAMKSASLAVKTLDRQLRGNTVDWETDYAVPLRRGVDTFRVFVDAWYDGRFQDIIFSEQQSPRVRAMICSILAGYAWDENNPYVKDSERRVNTLAQLCAAS